MNSKFQIHDSQMYMNNAAVHFEKFYNHEEDNKSNMNSSHILLNKPPFLPTNTIKSSFTQHMVDKLERLTGTVDYSRQVADLLNKTVEPPNFSIVSPPADNCAPDDDLGTVYPLWYKDPDKMSFCSTDGDEKCSKDKLIINQEKNYVSTAFPTDEWDLSISTMNSNKIQKNCQFHGAALKKQFLLLNSTFENTKINFDEHPNSSIDFDNEVTL